MKNLITTIGLEIHIQLDTDSKMFCNCSNFAENKAPNTVVCPVCMGMPGTLPVPNKKAIEWSIKMAHALGCKINLEQKFDRKNYFYPDLPKGYQISQLDQPVGMNGNVEVIDFDLKTNKLNKVFVEIERLHLEEDAGKLVHPNGKNYTLVDLNRAGTPLMEIVTRPVIHSPNEAKMFLETLKMIAQYLRISRADMEKGHLRCDANISLAEEGAKELGVKVEVKNLNSFRSVQRALEFEEKRQRKLLENSEKIISETRGWDEKRYKTISQRSKEIAPDYRYFPEPDIPKMQFTKSYVDEIQKQIISLPQTILTELIDELHLDPQVAISLFGNIFDVEHLKNTVALGGDAKKVARLMVQKYTEFRKQYRFLDIERFGIKPEYTLYASTLIEQFNNKIENDVLKEMFETKKSPEYIVRENKYQKMENSGQINEIIEEVIKENQKAVSDYKAGKMQAKGFLVGQIMKKTKGQINPTLANETLEKLLK